MHSTHRSTRVTSWKDIPSARSWWRGVDGAVLCDACNEAGWAMLDREYQEPTPPSEAGKGEG